ncbi:MULTISPECIES: hypothetical protein [unclassified Serratia (in: enterobacteria)]|uniref:hypothetical protein n=1 Tax=unclassified Serratia (in: enterobacteria) TaxID=2647522 RepID=UPI0004699EE0|nr:MULTISPECIES: hypothetical protein [unclassified Serratia (in: enterobacteria)]
MDIGKAFEIALSLVAFLGGIWVYRQQGDIKELQNDNRQIRDQYQRREDANRDFKTVLDHIQDVKRTVERIDNKLDRKADK